MISLDIFKVNVQFLEIIKSQSAEKESLTNIGGNNNNYKNIILSEFIDEHPSELPPKI